MAIVNDDYHSLYDELRSKGACMFCSYRFLPNAHFGDTLTNTHRILEKYESKAFANRIEAKKSHTCVVCLDMFSDNVNETVEQQVSSSEVKNFDCDSFMIALTVPLGCQLREMNVATFMKSSFPSYYEDNCRIPRMSIKEAWRYYICKKISKLIGKTYNTKSELIIQVTFSYENTGAGCSKLDSCAFGNTLKHDKNDVRDDVELMQESNLGNLREFPFTIPNGSLRCHSITVRRDAIFLAGRYNKFSRILPQTPWIFADGERKLDTSVEEIISSQLKKLTNAQESRFSSSGREDIDVRMLGNGRPFAVELINAKISTFLFHDLRLVEKKINNVDAQSVLVRDLQIVNRNAMQFLKNGEEKRSKDYCAICLVKGKENLPDMINALPVAPFHITQKTPLRVLHRRTVAVREKTIHRMSVELLNIQYSKHCFLMKLNLQTQAGTYVKEFIHGDFGRTVPNISHMLGRVPIDVLNLDVLNVEVDWPSPINYRESV